MKASIIAGTALVLGYLIQGGIQAATEDPEPLSCTEVRSLVLEQAQQDPEFAAIPYPEDSREQQECDINTVLKEID